MTINNRKYLSHILIKTYDYNSGRNTSKKRVYLIINDN